MQAQNPVLPSELINAKPPSQTKTIFPPTIDELLLIYNDLQSNPQSVTHWLTAFQWVRYDPRLAEILIRNISLHWPRANPIWIQQQLHTCKWPQVFAIICEHVLLSINKADKKLFRSWMKTTLCNIPKASLQVFFIGVFRFQGVFYKKEWQEPLKIYLKWGFLSSHLLTAKKEIGHDLKSKTTMGVTIRHQKLQELFLLKKNITLKEYLQACEYKVSVRTAEMDLKKWARRRGNTKAARYINKHAR